MTWGIYGGIVPPCGYFLSPLGGEGIYMIGRWKSAGRTGVRFREHPTRKHNGKPDRYFTVRYKVRGKAIEEGLGWASEGWTVQRAALERAKLKEAHRTGEGPETLAERRAMRQAEAEAEALEGMTFGDLAARYLEWAKANKKSYRHDNQRLNSHVLPVVGDLPVSKASAADVERLKVSCQEKQLAPATTNHCLQLVRGVYNFGARLGLYEGPNPTARVNFQKVDNKRTRFLSYEEAESLLSALANQSQDWHDITLLGLFAGLRLGEITALTWQDVDLEHGVLQIRDAKGGEGRPAYITDRLRAMLGRRKAVADNPTVGLVFPGRFGERIKGVRYSFENTIEELGWNDGVTDRRQRVTFHTTRHTFGSWLAIQGTPLLTIKELMGHKTIEMTMRYAHLIPDQKRDAVEELEKRVKAKVVPLRKSERA